MKKIIPILLAIALCCGCTDKAANSNTSTGTPSKNETSGTEAQVEGEIKYMTIYKDYSASKVITSSGKTLIPYSATAKGVVTDFVTHKPAYVFDTNYEKAGEPSEEDTYYYTGEAKPKTTLYDLEGNLVAELDCFEFYSCSGDYYASRGENYELLGIRSIKTGETVMEGIAEINDGGNCLILFDENYMPKYITDYDLNILYEVNGEYDSIYSPKTYVNEQLNSDYLIASKWGDSESTITLIDKYGGNVLGKVFTASDFSSGSYVCLYDGEKTYVYDGDTLELVFETDDRVSFYTNNYYALYRESGSETDENGMTETFCTYTLYSPDGKEIFTSNDSIYPVSGNRTTIFSPFTPGTETACIWNS